MLGYEAIDERDLSDPELISVAKRDGLILLTSDEQLYQTAMMRNVESFLVNGSTEEVRLAKLAERFNLRLKIDAADSRCPICGFPIQEKPKTEVERSIPPATFKVYQTFWVCTNPKCAKVYWQGSHWQKIERTLENARKIVETRTNTTARRQQTKPTRRKTAHSNSPPRNHNLSPIKEDNPHS